MRASSVLRQPIQRNNCLLRHERRRSNTFSTNVGPLLLTVSAAGVLGGGLATDITVIVVIAAVALIVHLRLQRAAEPDLRLRRDQLAQDLARAVARPPAELAARLRRVHHDRHAAGVDPLRERRDERRARAPSAAGPSRNRGTG